MKKGSLAICEIILPGFKKGYWLGKERAKWQICCTFEISAYLFPTKSVLIIFQHLFHGAIALPLSVATVAEPTNHLDTHNRSGLLRKLMSYGGTLIVVSHDETFLGINKNRQILWQINASYSKLTFQKNKT
ncbi:MAG: hypothetical protein LBC30_03630 [Puniceicoccales bacterium]|nr:hypothetical protein [Puniceicoccales bacterium]